MARLGLREKPARLGLRLMQGGHTDAEAVVVAEHRQRHQDTGTPPPQRKAGAHPSESDGWAPAGKRAENYSTVTDLARLRGLSMSSLPHWRAISAARNCIGMVDSSGCSSVAVSGISMR